MNALLDAALDYARRGWPVFPLWWPTEGPKRCACPKPDCGIPDPSTGKLSGSPAKHPRTNNGLKDATIDAATIRNWWDRWPEANLGIRTGIAFDALDVDGLGAAWSLDVMAEAAGEDVETCWGSAPTSITSRGWHMLYEPTGAKGTSNLVVPHVDWRGTDGYIVAPPSVHVSGHVYEWHPEYGPDSPLPLAPAFLIVELFPKTRLQRATRAGAKAGASEANIVAGIVRVVAEAAEGNRNNLLNWAAHRLGCHVADGKVEPHVGLAALDDLHAAAAAAGLADSEITTTIKSAWSAATRSAA